MSGWFFQYAEVSQFMDTSQQGSLFFRAGQPQHWKPFLCFCDRYKGFWTRDHILAASTQDWGSRWQDDVKETGISGLFLKLYYYIMCGWIYSPPRFLAWPSIRKNFFLFHLTVKVMFLLQSPFLEVERNPGLYCWCFPGRLDRVLL